MDVTRSSSLPLLFWKYGCLVFRCPALGNVFTRWYTIPRYYSEHRRQGVCQLVGSWKPTRTTRIFSDQCVSEELMWKRGLMFVFSIRDCRKILNILPGMKSWSSAGTWRPRTDLVSKSSTRRSNLSYPPRRLRSIYSLIAITRVLNLKTSEHNYYKEGNKEIVHCDTLNKRERKWW